MITASTARWIIDSGVQTEHLHRAWATGRAAQVPIGHGWDVVRVTRTLGRAALARAQRDGTTIGPVLETPARDALEFPVPPGTAAAWPLLPDTRAASSGEFRCPAPWITAADRRRSRCGRVWLIPPTITVLTDANALCEAVAAALATGHPGAVYGRTPTEEAR
ncbi:hypothetical protein [Streptomyces parvus]|uniref:hypothetical protein n=1 Tax=Streptomyces parvus TaxID=66428 RepID=UPI0036A0EB4F